MKTRLTLITLLAVLYSCTNAQNDQPNLFSLKEYASPSTMESKKDSSIAFVNLVLNNEFDKAEKIYPEMYKIDVSPFMNSGPRYKPYLGAVGEFVMDYSDTYSNMALAAFLDNKYNAHDDEYDMLLRASLRMDSTNVAAMFLLAKLRYENDITDDAYFLVRHMMKLEPENKKVRELHAWFQDNHEQLADRLPSFDQFIRQEVYYRELE